MPYQGPLISVLKRSRLTKNIDCSHGWFYSPHEGDYLMIPHFLLLKFVQSPIACKRCRNCDHEFKKRAESEPVAVVKKAPSKRGKPLLSADNNKPIVTRTIRPPPVLPTITPEEKERALFKEVNIVNKKCTYCSAPSPIACKKCRYCGGEFKRKGYIGSTSSEPIAKKPKRASPELREAETLESPELPVEKTRTKLRLDSIGTDAEHETQLRELYSEKKEHLSYILLGINDKITRTSKINGGIIRIT